MFNGQNIKNITEKRGIKIKSLYEGAGINQGTFFTIISERGNPTADKLEAIADFLECSIDDFFDRKVNYQSSKNVLAKKSEALQEKDNRSVENLMKEIENLRVLLKEKELLLQTKDKLIETKDELLKEKERTIMLLFKDNK